VLIVDFKPTRGVGELVTMKASVNYVGKSSMIVGILSRIGKHTNWSKKTLQLLPFLPWYQKILGNNAQVPDPYLSTEKQVSA
jgi:acyl-CoA hydrolase